MAQNCMGKNFGPHVKLQIAWIPIEITRFSLRKHVPSTQPDLQYSHHIRTLSFLFVFLLQKPLRDMLILPHLSSHSHHSVCLLSCQLAYK